jgi:hypothetical protein
MPLNPLLVSRAIFGHYFNGLASFLGDQTLLEHLVGILWREIPVMLAVLLALKHKGNAS